MRDDRERRGQGAAPPGHAEGSPLGAHSLSQRTALLDGLSIGCQIVDHGWRYVYVNEQAARHGRMVAERLLGRTMMECYPGIESTDLFRALSDCAKARKAHRMQNVFTYEDGTSTTFDIAITPIPEGLLISSADMTAQRRGSLAVERLAAIVESANEAIISKDLDGTITGWNRGAERLYGYSAEEVLGRSVSIIIPENQPEELQAILRGVARGERVEPYETVRKRKDGSRVRVLLTVSPIFNSDGVVDGASEIALDLTDYRKAQEEASENLSRFQSIAQTIEDVFWMTDVDLGIIRYVSPAFEKIWGQPMQSLYRDPRLFIDAVHPADRERVLTVIRSEKEGIPFSHEYRIIRPDGSIRWIADRGYPSRDGDGRVTHFIGVAQDITERKNAAHQISEQARLLEVASDAISVRDVHQVIEYWNRGAEQIFGWTREEAVGRELTSLLYSQSRQREVEPALEALFKNGEWTGELHPKRKDGREITTHTSWTLVRDEHGNPTSILSVSTDITVARSLEKQFLRAQRFESLGSLASGIAHDLNNVLSPILMGLDALAARTPDADATKIIELMRGSAVRGSSIVSQIVAFARGVEGERVELQLKHLVREIESIIRGTFPKSIELLLEAPNDLWMISGDSTQIHQVLMNLCVNARDAMPEGGTMRIHAHNIELDELYARSHIDARPIRYVCVEVADTGTGMPPEVVDRVFEPFFTTKPLGRGTGLGLSTSLTIVKSHGGFITVYSEISKGTKFTIYLPALTAEGRSPSEEEQKLDVPSGNGELILVVDDEPALRAIACDILQRNGYQTVTASDGAEALAVFARRQAEIRLVVLDMMMPYLDGKAAAVALRRIDPTIKLIGMSGLTSNERLATSTVTGLNGLIAKPFDGRHLLDIVNEVLTAI